MNNHELHAVTIIWHRVEYTCGKGNIVYLSRSGLRSVVFNVNTGCHCCNSAHDRSEQSRPFLRLMWTFWYEADICRSPSPCRDRLIIDRVLRSGGK